MDHETPFKTLLAKANDFDLVDSTFVKIGHRYSHWVDAQQYTPEERVVMLVWHAGGIIDNGGFEYLFSGDFDGDPDFRITAEAFQTAGLSRSHAAFQEAFQLFPDGLFPNDPEHRLQIYKRTSEERREEINEMVWKDGWDKLREKQLALFIRKHAAKFSNLDSRKSWLIDWLRIFRR